MHTQTRQQVIQLESQRRHDTRRDTRNTVNQGPRLKTKENPQQAIDPNRATVHFAELPFQHAALADTFCGNEECFLGRQTSRLQGGNGVAEVGLQLVQVLTLKSWRLSEVFAPGLN